jgi:hypothetical protein
MAVANMVAARLAEEYFYRVYFKSIFYLIKGLPTF